MEKESVEQIKKLQAADIKVRDLEKSRDKWKQEAKKLAQQNKQLEKEAAMRQAKAEKGKKRQ